jgi:hypothetical protein
MRLSVCPLQVQGKSNRSDFGWFGRGAALSADRLQVACFNRLADARAQLDVAIAQAMVRVARVEGSERPEVEAQKLSETLAVAIEAVRAVAR